MIVVEPTPHFGKDISNQVFEDRSLITKEISLQYVILRSIFQHTDKQAHVPHIHFESVFIGISVKWQLRDGQVITSGNDACIFDPLEASGIFRSRRAFPDNRVLELFVFLG